MIVNKIVNATTSCNLNDIGPELLNVSIRRIRLNSRILLNKKNRRKFNL